MTYGATEVDITRYGEEVTLILERRKQMMMVALSKGKYDAGELRQLHKYLFGDGVDIDSDLSHVRNVIIHRLANPLAGEQATSLKEKGVITAPMMEME